MSHSPPATAVTGDSHASLGQQRSRSITGSEWLACAIIVVGLVALRIHFVSQAGGMWRDEAHSVDVARDDRFPAWQDSFPILWIQFLRVWISVWGSSDDSGLRSAGLFCGLLMLGSALWAAQGRGRTIPWATLILFGLSPVAVTYGSEVRGYALGVATQLWMLGALQRFLLRPTGWGGLHLTLASLIAVQAAFPNSFLLLAGSLSAGILCVRERRWKSFLVFAANGILAAATVSPYILVLLPRLTGDWVVVVRQEFPITWYLMQMKYAFSAGGPLPLAAWILLGLGTTWAVQTGLFQSPESQPSTVTVRSGKPGAFEFMLLGFGTVLILAYLKWLKVPTFEWYYLPLMGLFAFCFDSVMATWTFTPRASLTKLGIALFLGAVQIPSAWSAANLRMTNVDLAGQAVTSVATQNDLVVVIPWYFGIPLQRYYHGPAPWICLPRVTQTEVPGIVIHADGYRAVKAAMMRNNSLEAELAQVRETLQRGDRVFVLGLFVPSRPGDAMIELPPAPHSRYGWSETAYETQWRQQLGIELRNHSTQIEEHPLENRQVIHMHEHCQLFVATGRAVTAPQAVPTP